MGLGKGSPGRFRHQNRVRASCMDHMLSPLGTGQTCLQHFMKGPKDRWSGLPTGPHPGSALPFAQTKLPMAVVQRDQSSTCFILLECWILTPILQALPKCNLNGMDRTSTMQ